MFDHFFLLFSFCGKYVMLFGGGSEASLDLKSVIEAWILYLNNQLKKKKKELS